jgi:hypothetical protein
MRLLNEKEIWKPRKTQPKYRNQNGKHHLLEMHKLWRTKQNPRTTRNMRNLQRRKNIRKNGTKNQNKPSTRKIKKE